MSRREAPRRAVVLVDHGSRREEANAQLEALAARVAERLPDHLVKTAHLELAEPGPDEAIDACAAAGATSIVVHAHFLAPGAHTRRDLPALVEAARARHPHCSIALGEPLGASEEMVDLVVERIGRAEAGDR